MTITKSLTYTFGMHAGLSLRQPVHDVRAGDSSAGSTATTAFVLAGLFAIGF